MKNDTSYYSNKLCSYPDPVIFSTSNVATSALALYGGYLRLNVDNVNIAPAWDLQRHLYIPNVNNSTSTTVGTTTLLVPQNSVNGNVQGFAPIQPCWIFNGKQNIQLSINLPQALAVVEGSSAQRIVVMLRGHLAQNVGINANY
jgi:hypothetical protein